MKDIFLKFPEPLRKQILLQCAGGGLGIAMLLILLVYSRDWHFLFPCAALAITCLRELQASAARLPSTTAASRDSMLPLKLPVQKSIGRPSVDESNLCICAVNSTPSNWLVSEISAALRSVIP